MRRMFAMAMAVLMVLGLCACGGGTAGAGTKYPEVPGLEDGVLTVGMECNYAPYNWTQATAANGAVAISNNPGMYANGYDVMIAKKIAEHYGVTLEIVAMEWDGLCAALSTSLDAVIAGQSMTAKRMAQVDMAGPYFYASIVCVTKKDSANAAATGISQLTGTCTAQSGTVWYESCLPQVEHAQIQAQTDTAANMIMAVESGTVDFICTDIPTAKGACAAYDDLVMLDFTGSEDNFQVSEEEIHIGISVRKGNTALKDMMDAVLSEMTVSDFEKLMDEAITIKPEI